MLAAQMPPRLGHAPMSAGSNGIVYVHARPSADAGSGGLLAHVMAAFVEKFFPTASRPLSLVRRRSNVLMFAAGFLLDVLTMQRIDAWTDLAIQLAYLTGLTGLLVFQHREEAGRFKPAGIVARTWAHNVEALHFLYGGLLSAYLVLYVRSSTGARPLVFFGVLAGLMVLNEMPQIRRAGHRLRLGLYTFCVLSFLNYFVPIVIGRMGWWVFTLALLLAAGIVWRLTGHLTAPGANRAAERALVFAPAAAVCVLIAALYGLRLIPPVPLSVSFQGIYHDVRRNGGTFTLVYEKPSAWTFWRRDSRPFTRRPGDRLFYFAQVFAPTRLEARIVTVWEVQEPVTGAWRAADRIPLGIVGGRDEGFRTFAAKANFHAGRWRVTAETDDGRAFATLAFRVDEDTGEGERSWATIIP